MPSTKSEISGQLPLTPLVFRTFWSLKVGILETNPAEITSNDLAGCLLLWKFHLKTTRFSGKSTLVKHLSSGPRWCHQFLPMLVKPKGCHTFISPLRQNGRQTANVLQIHKFNEINYKGSLGFWVFSSRMNIRIMYVKSKLIQIPMTPHFGWHHFQPRFCPCYHITSILKSPNTRHKSMNNLRIHTFAAVPFFLPLHFSALPAQPGS